MTTSNLQTWNELLEWLNMAKWQIVNQDKARFAFRGQSDHGWRLETSLGRLFGKEATAVKINEWRTRELKMYRLFRERLLQTYPGMYDEWPAPDIVSLMQHYGAPTRFIDFSYSPRVAAWFALKNAKGACAIWVVDRMFLDNRRIDKGLPEYCGPTHHQSYQVFQKDDEGKHKEVASILDTRRNERLAAQNGCFLVPGAISARVNEDLIAEKIILSESVVWEALRRLPEICSEASLFPNLTVIANDAANFALSGSDH